jgi:hypothetical protein
LVIAAVVVVVVVVVVQKMHKYKYWVTSCVEKKALFLFTLCTVTQAG